MVDYKLRPYQQEFTQSVLKSYERGINRQLGVAFTGAGKCLGYDTPVLMYDGTIKKVQNIENGELVMGDDSKPRTVMGVTSGQEQMYEIIPTKGERWTCNESHILTLVCNHKAYNYNELIDITVKDYLKTSDSFKHIHKLVRTGVEFPKKDLTIDPYLLGLWLGDGTTMDCGVKISNPDKEIHNWVEKYCNENGLNLKVYKYGEHCELLSFTDDNAYSNNPNNLTQKFRDLNLFDNKHIPHEYLTTDRQDRLQLLAGLLDTDGHLGKNGVTFEIIQKSETLIDQIIYLARSLGFACYKKEKIGKIKSIDFEGTYYRINITGDTNEIPTKVLRKQAEPRKHNKNQLRTGFKIKPLGMGTYYGFTLKENPRFLLGDFTIAHNTFMLVWLAKHFAKQGKRILVLCDQNDLVWQWQKNFQKFAPNLTVGIEKAEFKSKKSDQIVVGSVQTLGRKGKKRIKKFSQEHFDCVFTDECDKSITPTWIRILEYFGVGQDNFIDGNLLLGVTATPYRTSGESMGILYDDIVANYDIRYGISQGWLTDIELYNVQTNTDISNVKTNAGDFTLSDLSNTINTSDRNAQILKSYKELSDGQQAIVYCADVAHAYAVSDLFNAHDISSEVIEANTDKQERKEYMNEFDTGNIDVLCNYSTMSRGIDFPELRSIIFARPVKSKNLFTQILGRVLRTSETAEVDKYPDAQSRKFAIETSDKPVAKVIDLCDEAGKHNVVHLPSLFGLHDKLQPKKKQKFFKEVVEPLDRLKKEKKVDVSKIENLDEIELIVNKRNYELKSLELDDTVKEFTNRSWVETTNGYEISYTEENKVLIIESDDSSKELLDKSSWNLLEYDTDSGVTKNLQTFQSLSGAFKVADEYADRQGWDKQFMEKADWWDEGVTSAQIKWLNKFYRYKSGYSEFETINERYEDTGLKKLRWKKNSHGISEGTILTKKLASQLLQNKFGK